MNYLKIWLISCLVLLWWLISRFDASYGYFEYRYYCDIQTSTRITISLKPDSDTAKLCLSYVQTLDQSINYYSQQVKITQEIMKQGEFDDYRQSYLDEIQPKLLQSRFLHKQIIKSMNTFEADLFQKTMLYVRYRYKNTRKNLQEYVALRETSIINATDAGASQDLQEIIQKYLIEKRKLEVLNLIFAATNFNELMPFYTMYKKWEFDY